MRPLEVEAVVERRLVELRRKGALLCGAHRRDEQHVGRRPIELEVLGGVFLEHRRRERPEPLAELDLQVEPLLHLGIARVAEDAAVAERPRPELHAPLEPAAHLAGRQPRVRRRPPARRDRPRAPRRAVERANRPLGVEIRELRAEVACPSSRRRRRVRRPMPAAGRDGCATRRRRRRPLRPRRRPPAESRSRRTRRSSRSLPLATQFSATPPASTRWRQPVGSSRRARQPQHDLLGDLLDGERQVHVRLRQLRLGRARVACRTAAPTSARSPCAARWRSRSTPC